MANYYNIKLFKWIFIHFIQNYQKYFSSLHSIACRKFLKNFRDVQVKFDIDFEIILTS